MPVRVLVACEFSGVVRSAFRRAGHDAWSCDLLPSEDGSAFHIVGDVRTLFTKPCDWDLMIAHPPCTYLSNSGVRWLYTKGKGTHRNDERWLNLIKGAQFFRELLMAPVPLIAIENPVMHRYAREIIGGWSPSQIVHPWQFGHAETKATCLWLRGLPLLKPTDIVEGRTPRVHHASPSPDRWRERSRTLPGMAAAMAAQWGTA